MNLKLDWVGAVAGPEKIYLRSYSKQTEIDLIWPRYDFPIGLNFHELQERTEQRREKLLEFNLTLQPFAAIVGALDNPEGYYIVVNNVYYKTDSSVRMLELLYKLFHAFDVAYPQECEQVWALIDELVFEIKTSKKLSGAASVIADIQFYLNKEK